MTHLMLWFLLFCVAPAHGWLAPKISLAVFDSTSKRRTIPALRSTQDNSSFDLTELTRRIDTLRSTEQRQHERYLQLPVICFDSLLPNQVLEGRTTDSTFGQLLFQAGLGGQFVMVSLKEKERKLRRNGVVCKIEFMDARSDLVSPTAVDFRILGVSPCRLVGPAQHLQRRVGRWRRSYDENGEEAVMGWGEELFVDNEPSIMDGTATDDATSPREGLSWKEPSLCWVDCQPRPRSESSTNNNVAQQIKTVTRLLGEWEILAIDPKTYENTNVVASTRLMKGQPGLRVDPAALLRQVKTSLGECPRNDPVAFAYWVAALINPLPVLGVSPEIRGRVLEAPTPLEKLQIVEWGLQRSILNLQGTHPL